VAAFLVNRAVAGYRSRKLHVEDYWRSATYVALDEFS
jgi:hypothetical protein